MAASERAASTVGIASDHAGVELKSALAAMLRERGLDVLDLGTDGPDSVDYPDFADALANAMAEGREPMRTFSDLQQFFDRRHDEDDNPPKQGKKK